FQPLVPMYTLPGIVLTTDFEPQLRYTLLEKLCHGDFGRRDAQPAPQPRWLCYIVRYTIGRKRPTTSCKRPVIWPNEQTSAASSRAGKTFSLPSATAASLSSARFALSTFFFLNLRSRSTCNCCFAPGVRTSFTSGASSSPSRYLFKPMIGRVPS